MQSNQLYLKKKKVLKNEKVKGETSVYVILEQGRLQPSMLLGRSLLGMMNRYLGE